MTICHDIMSCQVVMTKSHGGILVNVNYQLNKVYTFTIWLRMSLDNNNVNETNKKEIKKLK